MRKLVDVLDLGDLVLLQIEFLEGVFERQQAFVDLSQFVGLNGKKGTPSAIC